MAPRARSRAVPPTPRHRVARRRPVRTLTGVLALSLVLTACARWESADPETKVFEHTGDVLDVRSDGVPTDLVAGERDDVEVTVWFDTRFATGAEYDWSLEGDRLDLHAGCTGLANCDARFRVEVPQGMVVLRDGQPTDLAGLDAEGEG